MDEDSQNKNNKLESFAENKKGYSPSMLNPSSLQNPVAYLQYLCNKYGDFKVARAWRNNKGEMQWSKHRSIMECWESEWGLEWLKTVNNRQILNAEIVIDLDENPTIEKVNWICDLLEGMGEHYKAYKTGSKGYHIHIWSDIFATFDINTRRLMRNKMLKVIGRGLDVQKNSEKVMIAIENAPHWKTGNKKELIRSYPKWEN